MLYFQSVTALISGKHCFLAETWVTFSDVWYVLLKNGLMYIVAIC